MNAFVSVATIIWIKWMNEYKINHKKALFGIGIKHWLLIHKLFILSSYITNDENCYWGTNSSTVNISHD